VAHDEDSRLKAHPKQDEAVLVLRVVGVIEHSRTLIIEGGLGLLERYTVLMLIRQVLGLIPNEAEAIHIYIVCKAQSGVKEPRLLRTLRLLLSMEPYVRLVPLVAGCLVWSRVWPSRSGQTLRKGRSAESYFWRALGSRHVDCDPRFCSSATIVLAFWFPWFASSCVPLAMESSWVRSFAASWTGASWLVRIACSVPRSPHELTSLEPGPHDERDHE